MVWTIKVAIFQANALKIVREITRARAYTIRELNNTKRLGYMEWIADYYRDIAAVEKSGNWQEEA